MKILFLAAFVFLLSACDSSSTVDFTNDSNQNSGVIPQPIAKQLAQTNGGMTRRLTNSGYKADFSAGARVNFIHRTTSSGYKTQLNISGQSIY